MVSKSQIDQSVLRNKLLLKPLHLSNSFCCKHLNTVESCVVSNEMATSYLFCTCSNMNIKA